MTTEWSHDKREQLEVALNESEVAGLHVDADARIASLLVDVLSLPEAGSMDNDRRRSLDFRGVSEVRVLLRRVTTEGNGPPVPLADMEAVEKFFDSLAFGDAMYGWEFFDQPDLTADWPETPSLVLTLNEQPSAHTFYWFNECCVQDESREVTSYCIEGTIAFDDVSIRRFDGSPIPIDDFSASGTRWWQAFRDYDERVSGPAQQGGRRWRRWPGIRTE